MKRQTVRPRLIGGAAWRDIPANIALIDGTGPKETLDAMVRAVMRAPCNTAVAQGIGSVPGELRDLVHDLRARDLLASAKSLKSASPEALRGFLRGYFNDLASRIGADERQTHLIGQWLNQVDAVKDAAMSALPGYTVQIELQGDGLAVPAGRTGYHLDNGKAPVRVRDSIEACPLFNTSARLVCVFDGPGTVLVDTEEVGYRSMPSGEPTLRRHELIASSIKAPVDWITPRWSWTLLTSEYYPHPPVAHASGYDPAGPAKQTKRAAVIFYMDPGDPGP